ncbi:MAG: hypothetical protein EPN62_13130 [Candidimonas sp.]|nr:MAG: hypothetical protein EPN77_11305 [Candidimonas sp.]TAM21904.1 MAG: hypothetical protein EPN62_13130 [Candidimonas sp.]
MVDDPDMAKQLGVGSPTAVAILHLSHRSKHYEIGSRDYEFSPRAC